MSTFPKTKNRLDKIFLKGSDKTPYEYILCKCFDCCGYNSLLYSDLSKDDFNEAVESIKYCSEKSHTCPLAGLALDGFPMKKKYTITEERLVQLRASAKAMRDARLNAKNLKE